MTSIGIITRRTLSPGPGPFRRVGGGFGSSYMRPLMYWRGLWHAAFGHPYHVVYGHSLRVSALGAAITGWPHRECYCGRRLYLRTGEPAPFDIAPTGGHLD